MYPEPSLMMPGSPLYDTTMLTSVGGHERDRIVRKYYPMGDPVEMMHDVAFARKYGLAIPSNLALTGRAYKMWFSSPTGKSMLVIAGLVVGGVLLFSYLKKKKVLFSAMKPEARWEYDNFGCVTIRFQDDKEAFLQSQSDVESFFEDIGMSVDKVNPGDWNYVDEDMISGYYPGTTEERIELKLGRKRE